MQKAQMSPAMFIGVRGKDIISFGSGQPDLLPPAAVCKVSAQDSDFRYGLIQGEEKLRSLLAQQYPQSNVNNFVVTNGASEALDLVLRVIYQHVHKKSKRVMIPQPYYYSYPHMIRFVGMEVVTVKTVNGRIDINDFRAKIDQCCAVIINSPSNPTGRVESIETLKIIERVTAEKGIYVLSDEVYKNLIYVRENYLIKGPHVITINSFSKTYSMCGCRIGYLWSKDMDLVKKIITMKTHTSMNTSMLSQSMAYAALCLTTDFLKQQLLIWKQRRDVLYQGLLDLGLEVNQPEGAFYLLPKIAQTEDFVWDMFHQHGVITYLGDWFGAPGHVRFSYALDTEKIEQGLKKIKLYLD